MARCRLTSCYAFSGLLNCEPEYSGRVVAVKPVENLFWKTKSVHGPAALHRLVGNAVVETLIGGFEEPVPQPIARDIYARIEAKKDSRGILDQKVAGRVGLPAELPHSA